MIGGLFGGLVSLTVGTVVGGLTVYIGVPLGGGQATPPIEESFVIGAVGAVLSVVITLLFGWIPLVGVLLPPAAWIGVVDHQTGARPATAIGVGLVAWAVTFVMTAGISVIALGGSQ